MSTTTTVTRDKDGRYLMLVTMDTDADALTLAASLATLGVASIRDGAQYFNADQRDKIKDVLQRNGWATPTYSMYDQLLTALS